MVTVGFCTSLDVDLSLECSNKEGCLYPNCGCEGVKQGIITTPCGCPQIVCMLHFEVELPRWQQYDGIHCAYCPFTLDNGGVFIRWENI